MGELDLENKEAQSNSPVNLDRSKVKFDLWERKLLDLSTRNSLLNLRIKGSSIPLFVPGCANIEDLIAQDKNFSIISRGSEEAEEEVAEDAPSEAEPKEIPDAIKPIEEKTDKEEVPVEEPAAKEIAKAPAPEAEAKPEEPSEKPVKEVAAESAAAKTSAKESKKIKGVPAKDYSIEDLADITEFQEFIEKKYEKGVLVSSITTAALDKNLTTLYRGAKASIEENGANTLFLACGFLKWFEKDRKEPCYAPILLIPVDLVKKFGIKYTMKRRDEDVQFNVTVSEKLRQDFKIEFDSFSKELPTDENGIDVNKVFAQVKEVIAPFKGWDIVESCVLGLFSFSQFVMWNDMHSHRASISENKIVKSLISGCLDKEFKDFTKEKVSEENVYLPIAADASQLAAIKLAGDGTSFVLHGPPGTGKSQTITSIIANCLANDKKVLFVAEKKAALDVVYKRLEKIGIAPFCLELHSNKARKSYVLDQLKKVVEESDVKLDENEYKKSLENIVSKRRELDRYVDELHIRRGCGLTLYELINIYASNQDAVSCGNFDEGFISELTFDRMKETETALGELVASSGKLEGKLPFVRSSEFSQDVKNRLPELVDAFIRAFDEFVSCIESFEKTLAANNGRAAGEPDTLAHIGQLNSCASGIIYLKSLNLPKGLLCCDDTESAYLAIRDMCISCRDAVSKRDALLANWQPGFLDLDGAMLLTELMAAKAKNALVRGIAENGVYKKVKAYDTNGNRKESLEQDFKALSEYRTSLANAMAFITSARGYLGELYNPGIAFPGFDIAQIEALNENAHQVFAGFANFDPTGSLRKLIGNGDAVVLDAANAFDAKIKPYMSTYDVLKNTYGFADGSFEPSDALVQVKKQMAESLKADSEFLRDRMQFNLMASKCSQYKVSNLVKGYDSGLVDGEDIVKSFRKGYSSLLISMIIDNSEVLRTFSGLVFEQKINELSRINDEFEKLTRQEIFLMLNKNKCNILNRAMKEGSRLSNIKKAISASGRGVSIRKLFSETGDLILQMCPCMLMSPLSCAQYLDPDSNEKFDIVVFDEASQLPTCKAIGVIARGKEAVIVGDPKQMPPTSFFTEQVNNDEADYETDDLESILDDCLAIEMPQMHLTWHYRSRHESLITFSNKSFYDGRLYTFPSPDDRQSKVTYVDCAGVFDSGKTRTNKTEAQAVIDEIIKRAHDPKLSKYSLGVVTFNIQQQSLIEDMLDEAASKDPELEKWAFGGEEPVFIKNLENVQGDERDVILFSVGYGKDETGKLIMNFGPLNRDGGWRRLNVAVTRSRIEMKVFSSISPEEIRINDTASEGVKAFKRFLQYASGSSVWDQDIASTGSSSDNSGTPLIDKNAAFTGIADDICARFKAIGYDTDKGVGKSGFKIDIGVVSPEKDGTYCLGILLDGPVYAQSGTTTSREVSQISMLKGFGWNIVRIWSLEWWENPDKVFEKLVSIIKDSKKEEEKPEEPAPEENNDAAEAEKAPEDTPAEEDDKSGPQVTIYGVTPEESDGSEDQAQKKTDDIGDDCPAVDYRFAKVQLEEMDESEFCRMENSHIKKLYKAIQDIVAEESPISFEMLAIRLINIAGLTTLTPTLRSRCNELINNVQNTVQITSQRLDPDSDEKEKIFIWTEDADADCVLNYYRVPPEGEKPRKASDIAIQEAACAANYIARSQFGMLQDRLIVETGKALGYSRVSKDTEAYKLGLNAINYCKKKEQLFLDDDGYIKGR